MFRPNTSGMIHKKIERRTAFGRPLYEAPRPIQMAIVSLGTLVEDSSVRADSSGSRGAAEITTASAKFLIGPRDNPQKGDVIAYGGELIEIIGVRRRNDVTGNLDHWEVVGAHKAEL